MIRSETSSLRKAALLVRSLDADSAAVLLTQLSPEEANAVRQAIRELGDIDPAEQEALRTALRPPTDDNAADTTIVDMGVELAISAEVPELPANDPSPEVELKHLPEQNSPERPFSWLEDGDMPSLAAMLEREHLSTIAVVLSHLSAARASEVLGALPPGRRATAIERLADLGESDRTSLEVIERELADWISAQNAERRRRADRLKSIKSILSHTPASTRDSVLSDIAQHDKSLASEIQSVQTTEPNKRANATPSSIPRRPIGKQAAALKQTPTVRHRLEPKTIKQSAPAAPPAPPAPAPMTPYFAFDRLTELNEQQLAELFRHCPGDQVVMALAGASERVTEHVESLLPRSVVKELRRRMHALSSVRLSELTDAQDNLAKRAGRLFESHKRLVAA